MDRLEIYKVIDGERNYQNSMIIDPDRPDMIEDLHLGDTLTAIQFNLDKARQEWYIGSVPHEKSMQYLRKIAGLIVQIAEKNGLPKR